jgi:hypothetical protein
MEKMRPDGASASIFKPLHQITRQNLGDLI